MPKRRHPSRFSIFKRSTRWKNGMGDLEFSCGALGRAAMTALTDHGLGFGTDDMCDMALAAATAMTVKTLAGEGNRPGKFKLRTWYCILSHLDTQLATFV